MPAPVGMTQAQPQLSLTSEPRKGGEISIAGA